jgi:fatty-acyl-CoA synthase
MSWDELDAVASTADAELPQAAPTTSPICNIQQRLDPLPAWRRGHPPRPARQPARAQPRPQGQDTDRCVSWLPWYHDMGLVGCLLSPLANQISVDYLKTEDFARRPLAWLDLISRNPGTTLSYSPTFGYDICARRMSSQIKAGDRFDLSRWRIAGNGADMIRPDVMQAFVDAFADAGFKASAFCPSYGLAEATLACRLMPPGEGIRLELVEESQLSGAAPKTARTARALPRHRQLRPRGRRHGDRGPRRRRRDPSRPRDRQGLGARRQHHGRLFPRRGSDRRLHGGRLARHRRHGLSVGGYIFIVGRAKDMIIINGRNHWPQDIEWAVEQLPGFKSGDIAAFAITGPSGEEQPAVLVHCRVSDLASAAACATTSRSGSAPSPA